MSNQPDRFALFILGPEEKRVEVVEDTHIANAASFILNKEDHTMGNMLRHAVMAVPGVLFAGYRVPHPLEPKTVIKIQTDGTLTPVQALKQGCEKVISQIGQARTSFKQQVQQFVDDPSQLSRPGVYAQPSAVTAANTAYGTLGAQRDDDATGYVDI